jgi:cellulose synthase/poly-beta-1,6-N-acetylglucosamine synthase-like glycosyltransferase
MIDLMFTAHNRRAYVEATFEALRVNTNWELISRLHVVDDRSTDGTYEHLAAAVREIPIPVTLTSSRFGGPVAAMNHVLDQTKADLLGKVDSDCVVCPGWLEHMLATVNAHPQIDGLGMEPGFAAPVAPLDVARTVKPARWIGGLGIFRTRVFARRRPVQSERFFGLTNHWRRFAVTAWVDPDLPVFLLDHLPIEPWTSLAREYLRKGWSREWPDKYPPEMAAYYDWWVRDQAAVA